MAVNKALRANISRDKHTTEEPSVSACEQTNIKENAAGCETHRHNDHGMNTEIFKILHKPWLCFSPKLQRLVCNTIIGNHSKQLNDDPFGNLLIV